jgi:hypothetical protein
VASSRSPASAMKRTLQTTARSAGGKRSPRDHGRCWGCCVAAPPQPRTQQQQQPTLTAVDRSPRPRCAAGSAAPAHPAPVGYWTHRHVDNSTRACVAHAPHHCRLATRMRPASQAASQQAGALTVGVCCCRCMSTSTAPGGSALPPSMLCQQQAFARRRVHATAVACAAPLATLCLSRNG